MKRKVQYNQDLYETGSAFSGSGLNHQDNNHKIITERKGYQWPASALTGQEMEILTSLRGTTGKPICELLRMAVRSLPIN